MYIKCIDGYLAGNKTFAADGRTREVMARICEVTEADMDKFFGEKRNLNSCLNGYLDSLEVRV